MIAAPDPHRAVLERTRETLRAALADVEAALSTPAEISAEPPDLEAGWPADANDPDLISTAAAADRAKVSPASVRRWCRLDEIGQQYGNHWRVSVYRLREHLAR